MSDHSKKAPSDFRGPGKIFDEDALGLAMLVVDAIWPLLVGGLILFIMILKGWERAAIPVGLVVILAQAWLTYG